MREQAKLIPNQSPGSFPVFRATSATFYIENAEVGYPLISSLNRVNIAPGERVAG